MAIEFLGLRTLIYYVADMEKAKDWYSNILGKAPYFDEPFYVGYNVGGYELGLHPADENERAMDAITYWGVNDVQEAFDTLMAEGATAFEMPHEVGGGIVVAAVIDLMGNALGIIYNPHFTL